ncbi:MAG: M3 family metallopeptidase [Bacteroidia bacterium]
MPQQISKNENILLKPWTGNYGGLPPFDKVKIEDFKPAIETAIKMNLEEIEAIASNPAKPDFDNTILALEFSGDALSRVSTIYYIWSSNMSSPAFQAVESEMEPVLATVSDKIIQNEDLFKRIESVYNSEEMKSLTSEQQRLTEDYYKRFVRSGARLNAQDKANLAAINSNLAALYTTFSQNLLHDENELMVIIDNKNDIAGIPQSLAEAAKAAAEAKGLGDKWVIKNTRSSVDPFLSFAESRATREKVWKMFVNRGDNGDEYDNNKLISEILRFRQERAAILGFESHAHWRLDNTMAKTPQRAMELMESVWTPAIKRVEAEVADMQEMANRFSRNEPIQPWDYLFYAEKVRKAKYDLDENEIKPYLQLEKLRNGMFWVAEQLFGLTFHPLKDIPVYHEDVRVWEVKKAGKHIGLWYFDPYARDGKRSGAWMNNYRDQYHMGGKTVTTIVSNNSNFVKPAPGKPVLLSWDDASTLFHEFGHALHGLCSDVNYKSLSGTSVVRDYVEFPSQLLEHWLSTPEVLQNFAIHFVTQEPMPKELLEKIKRASTFNEGYATTEYLASAMVDMMIHLIPNGDIDPDDFERKTLAKLNMPPQLVMRHRTPAFAHIFSSDAYSAGYYSYLWSDVITADAFEAFTEAGGPYDKEVAKRLYDNVFSIGNTIDPAIGYRNFRGKDPETKALMRKRGFISQ